VQNKFPSEERQKAKGGINNQFLITGCRITCWDKEVGSEGDERRRGKINQKCGDLNPYRERFSDR
jgi:hypothetical protein